jgi:hypothetical protein
MQGQHITEVRETFTPPISAKRHHNFPTEHHEPSTVSSLLGYLGQGRLLLTRMRRRTRSRFNYDLINLQRSRLQRMITDLQVLRSEEPSL